MRSFKLSVLAVGFTLVVGLVVALAGCTSLFNSNRNVPPPAES